MNFNFRVIPHRQQRYDTVGDYFYQDGTWQFRVSRMQDPCAEIAVFLHEIIEFFLCRLSGVKLKDIDQFDMRYEASRKFFAKAECGCEHFKEPGDDGHAPYHLEHLAATACERLIVQMLGVKWEDYERAVQGVVGENPQKSRDARPRRSDASHRRSASSLPARAKTHARVHESGS